MNILIINSYPVIPSLGGVERVSKILAEKFTDYYHHQVFFLSHAPYECSLLEEDIPQHQFFLPRNNGFENDENLEYYKNLLKEKKIDILINQAGLWNWMDKALAVTEVKVVSVVHSMPTATITIELHSKIHHKNNFWGLFFYYLKILFYPLFLVYRKRILLKENQKHYQYLSQKSNAIVTLANNYDSDLKSYGLNNTCLLQHIPNPNTFDVFSGKIAKENIILYVGRLSNYDKKPLRLLKIWRKLYRSFPNWKFIIVGDGEAKDEMCDFIQKYSLERVELKGKVLDVGSYYKKADFIVLTSEFEGWPMALTEGMTFGCIPFTFNNYGAASEIIDDGQNGCLIPPCHIGEYARRLSSLMSDCTLRKKMSLAAQQKSLSFSPDKILCKWNKLLTSI